MKYHIPANIYLFKVNNRNARNRCEIYSKLIDNFEHISHLFSSVSVVDFDSSYILFLPAIEVEYFL